MDITKTITLKFADERQLSNVLSALDTFLLHADYAGEAGEVANEISDSEYYAVDALRHMLAAAN